MTNFIVAWALKRASEKSTWVGIATMAFTAAHITASAGQVDAVTTAIAAVAGAVCVFTQAHKPD